MLSNRVIGAAICVASGALGLYAWQSYPWAASLFPLVVLILAFIGGAVMVAASFGIDAVPQENAPAQPATRRSAIRIIVSLLACTLAIPWLGFYTTCLVVMIVIPIVASGRLPTRRELIKDWLYGVVTVAAVYVVFEIWLVMGTPQGLLI